MSDNISEIVEQIMNGIYSIEDPVAQKETVKSTLYYWIDSAARFHRNETYYHSILLEIGEDFYPEAFTDDTGVIHDHAFPSKLPELISQKIKG